MGVRVWRIVVASVWFGVVLGLAFVETPLKFLAPGMTLPVALGIGRLVLTALDLLSLVFVVVLVVLGALRPRPSRGEWVVLGGLAAAVAGQLIAVRPLLNARTDIVLAGGDPGASPLHTIYVAIEVVVLVLLVVFVVLSGRRTVAAHGASRVVDGERSGTGGGERVARAEGGADGGATNGRAEDGRPVASSGDVSGT